MFVGVFAAILQAATQIQEQTLGFVPKLCAAVVALWWTAPWMWQQLQLLFVSALASGPNTL
jgi:flagellar biosynthesis protein FliQ